MAKLGELAEHRLGIGKPASDKASDQLRRQRRATPASPVSCCACSACGAANTCPELFMHMPPVSVQHLQGTPPNRRTHAPASRRLATGVGRQTVALLVLPRLDAVLGQARETIGVERSRTAYPGRMSRAASTLQHLLDRAHLQFRLASAAHQLERLADELDLADTALPQLDVRVMPLQCSSRSIMRFMSRIDSITPKSITPIHKGPQHAIRGRFRRGRR